MNALERIDHWSETHRSFLLDTLRIFLGGILILKGIEFGGNPKELYILIKGTPFEFNGLFMVHYITMAHFAGGVMIMLGLLTRFAILFQVPIVMCAVIFIRTVDVFSFYTNQLQALAVLILLIIFLFYGSGKISLDEYMKHYPNG